MHAVFVALAPLISPSHGRRARHARTAILRERSTWLIHVAHNHVQAQQTKRHLRRDFHLVSCNAMSDSSALALFLRCRIQIDSLANAILRHPTEFLGTLKRPRIGFVAVDLTGALRLQAFHRRRRKHLRVDLLSDIFRRAERQRLQLSRILIDAHVNRGVLGRSGLVIVKDFGKPRKLRLRVNEERHIREVLRKLFVVELLVKNHTIPSKHERSVGARTNRQVHCRFACVRREIRVNDDSFHAFRAKLSQAATSLRRLRRRRLRTPYDEAFHVVGYAGFLVGLRKAFVRLEHRRVRSGLV